ncbi:MAG TPA: hypothetical protein DCQ33_04930 [Nitrospira sp.]|nr:hypothetical protein [Nitrospira sp.]
MGIGDQVKRPVRHHRRGPQDIDPDRHADTGHDEQQTQGDHKVVGGGGSRLAGLVPGAEEIDAAERQRHQEATAGDQLNVNGGQ